tara:strand:- start:405 stop:1478 length:1074 start_codon:yes stop_codon:yes gene_type:complete
MKEYLEKYKYHIGGSSIVIIILYFLYSKFFNESEVLEVEKSNIVIQKEPDNKFVKAEISHEEFLVFMKTLKDELQNLTQSLVKFNANQIKNKEYLEFKKNLFTKDIIKKSILVDSISAYQEGQETSNYTVNFGGSNSPEVYKNVIGFRLVNAIIPYTVYTVNDNNKNIKIDSTSFDLVPGSYTFTELGNHLQTQINASALSGYTVISDLTTYKYTIKHASSFTIKWSEVSGYSYRLFGFEKEDTSGSTNTYTSTHSVDHSIHYADLVIDEIPSIACKMSSKGKQIIARIPFNNSSGGLVYYRAPEGELQTSNYFYPMKLSSLSIKLFDDNGNEYDSNNGDNYFEFEITIVENTELFK